MSVQKFTSLPVEVEAIQYDGLNVLDVDLFAGDSVTWEAQIDLSTLLALYINTKQGKMFVSVGDYVVKEPFPTGDRDFYPCKKDIFEKRYRKS